MSGSAGEMKASLLLTLNDELSGGLDRLLKTLGTLDDALKRLTQNFDNLHIDKPFDKAGSAVKKLTEDLSPLQRAIQSVGEHWHAMTEAVGNSAVGNAAGKIGALGTAAAGYSIVEPVRKYAEYENILRHIAITEHLSGAAADAEIARLTKLIGEDAQRSGQSSQSIAEAYYDFVTSGLGASTIDKIIAQHSMAATAYNISAEALGPAVLALINNMHIPEADIGAAIGAMAEAAKSGRFKVEDFAREFPGVSGFMSTLGMTGREGADYGFAALETVMKNSSQPSQAAADFVDALNYLTGNAAKLAFGRSGIDLHQLLADGEKAGKNPIDTILDKLAEMTKGKSPVESAEVLHNVLHNQQAEQALLALLQHREELNALKTTLDQKDATAVANDFATAFAGPIVQMRLFDENLAQINRTAGDLFLPTLSKITAALHGVDDGFAWMSTNFPGLTKTLGDVSGGFLALVAGLGALGAVVPLVTGGLEAMAAVVAVLAAPEALAVAAAGGMAAGIAWLANHPDAAKFALGPGSHPAIQPGDPDESLLSRLAKAIRQTGEGRPDATGGGLAPKIELHVTADPGLNVTGTSDNPVHLTFPSDRSRDRVLGRD